MGCTCAYAVSGLVCVDSIVILSVYVIVCTFGEGKGRSAVYILEKSARVHPPTLRNSWISVAECRSGTVVYGE